MNTKTFKIAELTVSRHNVRASVPHDPAIVQALADNIIAIHNDGTLIHPITVQEVDGKGQVVAGRNRMLALQFLIEDGRLPEDATTACNVVESDAEAVMVSQSENVMVQKMHPVAEFAGFQKLVSEGHSIEAIALAFGQTPRYVEGRLRLATVAPVLLDAFQKNNNPTLEQVMALALTDDQTRQIAVWSKLPSWGNSPSAIRRALAGDGTIDASNDSRTKLVSVAEYKAAGGRVQDSLLTDHTYLLDTALFEQLVADKLNAAAAEVQNEGWSWVEVLGEHPHQTINKLGTTNPEERELTDAEQQQLDALTAAYDAAAEAYNQLDEDDEGYEEAEEAASAAMEDAEQAVNAYQEQFETYTAEQKAFAGAVVYFESGNGLTVRRGLVRREDRRALDEAARQGRVASGVSGGRTTGDAGRPTDGMSAALKDDLRGLRIIAVQNVVAKNARVAKVLMALWAVEEIRTRFDYDRLPIELSVGHTSLRARLHMLSQPVKEAHEAQAEAFAEAIASLPEQKDECWDALMQMADAELDQVIAYAIAGTIMPADDHDGITGRLLDAVGFDMADHFTATAENYTGRVSKALLKEAIVEAGGNKAFAEQVADMKKAAAAEATATALAGTRWVPALIRTPNRAPKSEAAKEGKPAAKKSGGSKEKAPAKAPATKKTAKK